MTRRRSIFFCLALISAAIPLRAANRPHAGRDRQNRAVWTNDDLEKLHDLGLISIVGPPDKEGSATETALGPSAITHDRQWYGEESAKLHGELERRETSLRQYRQAIEDARSLRTTTGGVNFSEGHIGITPRSRNRNPAATG